MVVISAMMVFKLHNQISQRHASNQQLCHALWMNTTFQSSHVICYISHYIHQQPFQVQQRNISLNINV
jgi:hypothetical protein